VLGPLHQTSALGVNADTLVAHQAERPRTSDVYLLRDFDSIIDLASARRVQAIDAPSAF
jgi:hypothetical protein